MLIVEQHFNLIAEWHVDYTGKCGLNSLDSIPSPDENDLNLISKISYL